MSNTGGSGLVAAFARARSGLEPTMPDDLVSEPPQRLRVGESHEPRPDHTGTPTLHALALPDFWPVSRTYIQARASTMPP